MRFDILPDNPNYATTRTGRVYSRKSGKWKELRAGTNSRGYLCVALDGSSKCVHQLVAKQYIPNPNGYREINHRDGNKQNNNAKNLEWCTRSHNISHAYVHGLRDSSGSIKATAHPIMIVETGQTFRSISECARYLGVSFEQVRCCLDEKKTQHHSCRGFHFKRIKEAQE